VNENKILTALGMMSGTSMDAIDLALIKTDGENVVEWNETFCRPYTADERNIISYAQRKSDRYDPSVLEAENLLTDLHAEAVDQFLNKVDMKPNEIDVIGFHGQTIFHDPDDGVTVQIGNGQELAKKTNIPVVYDFRTADVKAGGQGAPLVPVYQKALVADIDERPLAIVNIGGVSNITYIGDKGELIAFDTGPGNALMNDWMLEHKNSSFDHNGDFAATGQVDEGCVRRFLNHEYFSKKPPKSLDRHDFLLDYVRDLDGADAMATLAAMTVMSIYHARNHLPNEPAMWLITGGGRHNQTLVDGIRSLVDGVVMPVDTKGWRGDFLEAEAFAYMAVRHLKGLPLTFPETTGCAEKTKGGVYVAPDQSDRLRIVT
jgi:anhydro-N-acetylmuramic acid kinase